MTFNRQAILKQPSKISYNGKEIGFTASGFTLDLNPQYDFEYSEEFPTIPIMATLLGLSPILTVELLEGNAAQLANAFGGFASADGLVFPSDDSEPGMDTYENDKFTGAFTLSPRYGTKGWTITGGNVLAKVIGPQRFSTVDMLTMNVAFYFLFDDAMKVINISVQDNG